MKSLYPPIEPYDSGMLQVSEVHHLYYEQCGDPNGKPVVFLHGGPGAGLIAEYRSFFDPERYRIILFDQRGAGKSTPHASLEENTTWNLVGDLETLRRHFGVDRWMVFGGSWGSTLALAYAERHPERVTELVLRGIFLCRPKEIRWFYQEGASMIYPDAWESFAGVIPEDERDDLVAAFYRRLTSDDRAVRLKASRAWSVWEGATSKLLPDPELVDHFAEPAVAEAIARIECHYFVNDTFFETDNWLIENLSPIRRIPAVIVQGRYDVVCPMVSAWELHRAWPEAHLEVVPDAGHSAMERGITSRLVEATDRFR
ncbi:MAG TPA: prolyl aminopeptidase [Thermoanaerobaculia bacterium]|nr:prolyl aminopeptidase [Thermoanaerobaculia bacterium]